jgi:transcriptional regulator with XRE-family HTH domain
MKLGEKLRYLREVEGSLRGLGRAMTQQELVRSIRAELKTSMSQSYLSQIESGARPHLTNTTRQMLAKFFKVHPGYLVDDPEGYHAELMSQARVLDDKLDQWLVSGAERFPRDPELRKALLALARHPESRRCLLLLESLIETPGLVDRLIEVLRPAAKSEKHFIVRPAIERPETKTLSPRARSVQSRPVQSRSVQPGRRAAESKLKRRGRERAR